MIHLNASKHIKIHSLLNTLLPALLCLLIGSAFLYMGIDIFTSTGTLLDKIMLSLVLFVSSFGFYFLTGIIVKDAIRDFCKK